MTETKDDAPKRNTKPKLRRRKRSGGSRQIEPETPPPVTGIGTLIEMAQSGKQYRNINADVLWKILPQLIEIDSMVGMQMLKKTLFHQIVYFLQDLNTDSDTDYLHTVILGNPGTGKCLDPNVFVMMYDGTFRCAGDVQRGDLLMGDDSTPRRVLSTCKGTEDMYDIVHENQSIRVNASHVLSLIHPVNESKVDISVTDYLRKPSEWQVGYLSYKVPVYFQHPYDLPIYPYVLGYIIAGMRWINRVPCVPVLSDKVYTELTHYNVISMPIHTISIYYTLSSQIQDALSDDILSEGAIPHSWLCTSFSNIYQILSGIIDAIGSRVTEHTAIVGFDGTQIPLMRNVQFMCDIAGIPYTESTHGVNVTQSVGQFTGATYCRLRLDYVSEWFHRSTDTQCLLLSPIRPYTPLTFDVVAKGSGQYAGFELDGNGRFLLHDCTVTHNTTIARIIGELYKNMGILSPDGIFKIATREDLVAEYLGQTAIKTRKLLESCIGGVLFIDEVYALGPGKEDKDSFSKEAIDTLNVFLSENANNFCCIISGYDEAVNKCFFSVNEGLRRRFQWVHRINTYSVEELVQIFDRMLDKTDWKSNVEDHEMMQLVQHNQALFNSAGGDVENLLTKCKIAHAIRILSEESPVRKVLTIKDVEQGLILLSDHQHNTESDSIPDWMKHMYV